ncbi:MAG: Mth938-like domain-containing protein [Parasphingorhabdus sp.]|uniref:Mth938-like domain-containing protein n=1 Tax=Parasphingorhabdus sp. TaxID=2709688 RepID=UPI0032993C31
MVELRRDVKFEGPVVTGFTPGGFKIGEQRFDNGLLISPQQALDWTASKPDSLDLSAIIAALNLSPGPEFLLFGSGAKMEQPPAAFRRAADALQLGIEVMDSRAAARAWGVLRAEERWIIGAFLPLR